MADKGVSDTALNTVGNSEGTPEAGDTEMTTSNTGPAATEDSPPSLPAAAEAVAAKPSAGEECEDASDAGPSDPGSGSGSGTSKQKKKPRLQWDEENLMHNALEMERSAYPKIDEPKTPFHASSGSEGGSVSSGSAPHSPGSPAFISRDNLVGFSEVEQTARVVRQNSTPSSADGRGSADGPSRSVHILEDTGASSGGESSPRSKEEFENKRKNHYKKEHPRFHVLDGDDVDGQNDADEITPDIEADRAQRNTANGANGRLGDSKSDSDGDDRRAVGVDGNGNGDMSK